MAYTDFMNKVRFIDNKISKWMMRHFYYMFFQGVLLIIFLFWFTNMFKVIDSSIASNTGTVLEKLLATQSVNTTIIVLLLLLNSFWLLYIFNGIQRMTTMMRDMNYNLTRMRFRPKKNSPNNKS